MARLMPPVLIGNREVTIMFSLPEELARCWRVTAHETQIARSDLLQRFLDRYWGEFTADHLMTGMTFYKHCSGGWLSQPVPKDAPAWLADLIECQRGGERSIVITATVAAEWYRQQAASVRQVEMEFYTCSLSDVMTLFFAWGWDRFENEWRSTNG